MIIYPWVISDVKLLDGALDMVALHSVTQWGAIEINLFINEVHCL